MPNKLPRVARLIYRIAPFPLAHLWNCEGAREDGPCDRAGASIGINGTDPSAQTLFAREGSWARPTPTFQKTHPLTLDDLLIAPRARADIQHTTNPCFTADLMSSQRGSCVACL